MQLQNLKMQLFPRVVDNALDTISIPLAAISEAVVVVGVLPEMSSFA